MLNLLLLLSVTSIGLIVGVIIFLGLGLARRGGACRLAGRWRLRRVCTAPSRRGASDCLAIAVTV
jgi:hypothetical protein